MGDNLKIDERLTTRSGAAAASERGGTSRAGQDEQSGRNAQSGGRNEQGWIVGAY
jgi:hypothetical protein